MDEQKIIDTINEQIDIEGLDETQEQQLFTFIFSLLGIIRASALVAAKAKIQISIPFRIHLFAAEPIAPMQHACKFRYFFCWFRAEGSQNHKLCRPNTLEQL